MEVINEDTFKVWFENELQKNNVNKAKLSREVGISRNSINNYMVSDRLPNFYILTRIVDFFGYELVVRKKESDMNNE